MPYQQETLLQNCGNKWSFKKVDSSFECSLTCARQEETCFPSEIIENAKNDVWMFPGTVQEANHDLNEVIANAWCRILPVHKKAIWMLPTHIQITHTVLHSL